MDEVEKKEEEKPLIPEEAYLLSGVHIGTRQKSADMKRFIYKVRDDGLYLLDVKETDRRIKLAAKFLSAYPPERVAVISSRQYGQKPAKLFAELTGGMAMLGRFTPGTFTNPDFSGYQEPDVVLLTDPLMDSQALKESSVIGMPVIAICDTNNDLKNLDLIIPANNKGRKSLALIYFLLTREVLRLRGRELELKEEDFEESFE